MAAAFRAVSSICYALIALSALDPGPQVNVQSPPNLSSRFPPPFCSMPASTIGADFPGAQVLSHQSEAGWAPGRRLRSRDGVPRLAHLPRTPSALIRNSFIATIPLIARPNLFREVAGTDGIRACPAYALASDLSMPSDEQTENPPPWRGVGSFTTPPRSVPRDGPELLTSIGNTGDDMSLHIYAGRQYR